MKFKHHEDHRILRKLPAFLLMDWWITLGDTCYGPDWVPLPLNAHHYRALIAHEEVHSDRQLKWMETKPFWLWILLYALFPVPIFFSWFRWKEERVAYLKDLEHGATIDEVVESGWDHFYMWPRFLMKKWFKDHARHDQEKERSIS